MIIALQFLLFSELDKDINYFHWQNNANKGIEKLDNDFDKNINKKIKDLASKFRNKQFISLGSVKPKYVDENVFNLSDNGIKRAITQNIQNMAEDDFFKDLNIIEFAKYIETKDLRQYFQTLANQSYDQEGIN